MPSCSVIDVVLSALITYVRIIFIWLLMSKLMYAFY